MWVLDCWSDKTRELSRAIDDENNDWCQPYSIWCNFYLKLLETLQFLWHLNHVGRRLAFSRLRPSWSKTLQKGGCLSEKDIFNNCKVIHCTLEILHSNIFLLRAVAKYTYEWCSDVWSGSCAALASPGPVILVTCEHQAAVDNNAPFICLLHNVTANCEWLGGCIIPKICKLNRS